MKRTKKQNNSSNNQGWSGQTNNGINISRNIYSSGEDYFDNDYNSYEPVSNNQLQKYLNEKYPNKEVKKIEIINKNLGGELDLSEYLNIEELFLGGNKIISVDFLRTILYPEKLKLLSIYDNNIRPTNIEVFSRFIGLMALTIGTTGDGFEKEGKHNKFYGSLKSYQGLTKLCQVCIMDTDISEGLEYLPTNLAILSRNPGTDFSSFECFSHDANSKCKIIQDKLRPYNYDVQAWQLAHPNLMYISRPELFIDEDSKEKWLQALEDKLSKTQSKLSETKENEPQTTKRIERLATKILNLEEIKKEINLKKKADEILGELTTQIETTPKQY